jgi:hypothetical protein
MPPIPGIKLSPSDRRSVPTADQLRRSKHLVKSDVRAECYGLRALPPVEKR